MSRELVERAARAMCKFDGLEPDELVASGLHQIPRWSTREFFGRAKAAVDTLDRLSGGGGVDGCFCDQMRADGYREVCPWCIANKDWSRGPTPIELAALSQPIARANVDRGGWQPINTFAGQPTGQAHPVIIAVTGEGRDVVGEAYFNPEVYDGTWWWAGTADGEYADSPVEDIQHGRVSHWQPLPKPPTTPPT